MFEKLLVLVRDWVAKQVFQYMEARNAKAAEYVKTAYILVGDIVESCELEFQGQGRGAEKKAAAVARLTEAMIKHGLNLPGELEKHLAGVIVEGAVLAMKQAGGSFIGGLSKLLPPG